MCRCQTRCTRMRDCQRHPCKRRCCAGDCPPCDQPCNRRLKCGNHRCPAPCHPGKSPPSEVDLVSMQRMFTITEQSRLCCLLQTCNALYNHQCAAHFSGPGLAACMHAARGCDSLAIGSYMVNDRCPAVERSQALPCCHLKIMAAGVGSDAVTYVWVCRSLLALPADSHGHVCLWSQQLHVALWLRAAGRGANL